MDSEAATSDEDRSAWSRNGPQEVADGIWRIPLPLPQDGLKAVNVYAIRTGRRVTLIDAGWALRTSEQTLEDSLSALGFRLSDISKVLVTHAHRDHYTQAVTIRRRTGATIALGAGERPAVQVLNTPGTMTFTPQLATLARCGAASVARRLVEQDYQHEVDPTHWEPPDHWVTDRETVRLMDGRELTCVATPGHTRGHVVFADESQSLLFSGDHILPHITPSIGFEPVPIETPLHDYIASLLNTMSLPDKRLLPAHGPVANSTHERAGELLRHHGQRLRACEATVRSGAVNAHEVANELRWTRHHRHYSELDTFNQMLAVMETEAHLRLLADSHRIQPRVSGGDTTYREVDPQT